MAAIKGYAVTQQVAAVDRPKRWHALGSLRSLWLLRRQLSLGVIHQGVASLDSKDLVDELRKIWNEPNNQLLARHVGVSYSTLQNWHANPRPLSARQTARLMSKCHAAGKSYAYRHGVKPIVEYYPIEVSESKQAAKWELFDAQHSANKRQVALKQFLGKAIGVYVFYDSAGNALYVGKTIKKDLWFEMNDVLNRARQTQKIRNVAHPVTGSGFRPAFETPRQIQWTTLQLADLAHYFSAYEVQKDMISNVEALLVRSFANSLLNVRMEKFEKIV